MKTASAKNKGRKLQQWARDKILNLFTTLTEHDVRSTSMGAGGLDVQLSEKARRVFPFAIECKNQERVNLWAAFEQAQANSEGLEPIVVLKKNGKSPVVILDADTFFVLARLAYDRPEA